MQHKSQYREEVKKMSEKEKQVMERLAENLKDMDDEDKNSLIERAEGMAYMPFNGYGCDHAY